MVTGNFWKGEILGLFILGIESSCDETAASIVEDGRNVISSIVVSQLKEHKKYGGVVPEIASRRHIENIALVGRLAVEKANISLKDIDAIAVTFGPGLIGSLLVGVNFAKGLSIAIKKPLIAVNHIKAHIASNYISHKKLFPPFLALVVSGGHTNILLVKSYTELKLIGKTLDDAIGETYDKVGRSLGLSYPAGPKIDILAKKGNENAFEFPKPKIKDNPYNFSFSGIKTSVINSIKSLKKEETNIEDVAASFQKTVCEIVCEKLFLAAKNNRCSKIAVAGGVSCNSYLRKNMEKYCKKNNIELYMPELKYCTDNAAMVASQGYFEYKANNFEKDMSLNAISFFEL